MNHGFFMVGYPTSSIYEDLLIVPDIVGNQKLDTIKVARFRASIGSPAVEDPELSRKLGVTLSDSEENSISSSQYLVRSMC
jgi:hypothetical protein